MLCISTDICLRVYFFTNHLVSRRALMTYRLVITRVPFDHWQRAVHDCSWLIALTCIWVFLASFCATRKIGKREKSPLDPAGVTLKFLSRKVLFFWTLLLQKQPWAIEAMTPLDPWHCGVLFTTLWRFWGGPPWIWLFSASLTEFSLVAGRKRPQPSGSIITIISISTIPGCTGSKCRCRQCTVHANTFLSGPAGTSCSLYSWTPFICF